MMDQRWRRSRRQMMLSDDDGLSRPIQPVGSSLDAKIERTTRDTGLSATDVLCGRGKTSFNHAGNKRFRDAVNLALADYMKSVNRFGKSLVVHTIVDTIHSSGGRFLKKEFQTGKWHELSDQQAKEKVGHAIRDAVNAHETKQAKEHGKEKPAKKVKKPAERRDSPNSESEKAEGSSSSDLVALPASVPNVPARAALPKKSNDSSPESHDEGHEQQFLAQIDAILGPLPPDAEDPMEPLLKGKK